MIKYISLLFYALYNHLFAILFNVVSIRDVAGGGLLRLHPTAESECRQNGYFELKKSALNRF